MTARLGVGRGPAVAAASMMVLGFGSCLGFFPGYFVAAPLAGFGYARASGVTMTGYYLGALDTPVTFGALVDWLGTYTWAWHHPHRPGLPWESWWTGWAPTPGRGW